MVSVKCWGLLRMGKRDSWMVDCVEREGNSAVQETWELRTLHMHICTHLSAYWGSPFGVMARTEKWSDWSEKSTAVNEVSHLKSQNKAEGWQFFLFGMYCCWENTDNYLTSVFVFKFMHLRVFLRMYYWSCCCWDHQDLTQKAGESTE